MPSTQQNTTASNEATCPNCSQPVAGHPESACVLAALIQIIREREMLSEQRVLEIHGKCDIDSLWTVLTSVIDRLEAGEFSSDEGIDIPFGPAVCPFVPEDVKAFARLET